MYDQNLRTRMATMSPQQLKQFAMMHKDDPFVVSMALDIDNTRKAGQRQQALQAAQQPQPKVVDQTLASIGQPEIPPQAMQAMQAMQAAPQAQAGLPQIPAQNIATMADGGIAGYAEGDVVKSKRSTFDATPYLQDPNVQRFLAYINTYEGAPQPNQTVGYHTFEDMSQHPNKRIKFNKKGDKSTAAGSYQLLNRTWKAEAERQGLTDFSLENQQRAAIGVLKDTGALDSIVRGDFDTAKKKAAKAWASLPGSTIGEATGQQARVKPKAEEYLAAAKQAAEPVMAEAGTREAPRTPEMLARQKAAIRRRELLASLPLSAAQAGESASRDPSQPSFLDKLQRAAPPALGGKGELVSEVFGKNRPVAPPVEAKPSKTLPVTKEGKSAPIVDDSVYDPMTGALISGGVPSTVGPQTKSPVAAQLAGLADIVPKAIYGLGTTASENVLALPFGKDIPTEKRRETAQQIMSPFYKYGTVGGITGLANDPAYASDPASQLLNVVQNNLEKSDEAIAAMTGAKPDNVRLARENVMAVLPLAGKVKPVETGMPKLPGKGKPNVTADAAAAEAAAQAQRVAEAEAKVAPIRIGYNPTGEIPGVIKGTPEGLVLPTGEAAAARQRGLAALAEDTNALNMARKSATAAEELAIASRAAETQTAAGAARSNKLSNAGKTAAAISSAGVGLQEPTDLYSRLTTPKATPHVAFSEEPGYDYSKPETAVKPTAEATTPAAPGAAPAKKTGGFSDEDWLMMGLNMLQAPPGQVGGMLSQLGQNIGRSGLATLGAKREREKLAVEQAQKEALSGYYKGMTENLGREPETIRQLRALQADPKLMDTMMQMEAGKDIAGQRAKLLQLYDAGVLYGTIDPTVVSKEQYLAQYGGPMLGGNTNLFKVVGSRPQ
jgi:muramidase (phage lysozyme)